MRAVVVLALLSCACGVPCEEQVDYRTVVTVPVLVHGMTSEDLDRGVELVMGAQLGASALFGVTFEFKGVALDGYVRQLDAFHEPSSTFLDVTNTSVVDVFMIDKIETNEHEYAAVTYAEDCSTAIVASKTLSSGGFLHEFGHALSLEHVSYQANVMNVSFSARDLPQANILPLQYERARTCLACLIPCWQD
jgi:hypothetical protein